MPVETKAIPPDNGFDAFIDFLFNTPSSSTTSGVQRLERSGSSDVGQEDEGYNDIEQCKYDDDDEISIALSMCSSKQQLTPVENMSDIQGNYNDPYLLQVTQSYLDSITKTRHYTIQYSGLSQSDKDGDDTSWSFSAVGRETVSNDSHDEDDYSISSEVCDPSFGNPGELFRDVMKLEDIGRLKALP